METADNLIDVESSDETKNIDDDVSIINVVDGVNCVNKNVDDDKYPKLNSGGRTEICVVTAGNVDAGKSTWIGVIKYNILDDGKGFARDKVAKHPHEIDKGKTSDISCRVLQLSKTQEIVMADLCGHEKYLKTTLFGMTGWFPDYGVLIVAANTGFKKMTREHMGLLLYLKIPFIVVITRIDIAPQNIYDSSVKYMNKIVRKFGKRINMINTKDEYDGFNNGEYSKEQFDKLQKDRVQHAIKAAKTLQKNNTIIPCVSVSNKTGAGIEISKELMKALEPREKLWKTKIKKCRSIFYIDDKFLPPGAGLVVSGVLKGKNISIDPKFAENMFIGPYNKKFIPVKIRTIHDNNKINIRTITDRKRGCIAIRILDKGVEFGKAQIRKGMIVSNEDLSDEIAFQFKCEIRILNNHSTTISKKYSPVVHCGPVRQTAKIILKENQVLEMGDKAEVSFRFVERPEFIEVGAVFLFREGTTRGLGTITEVLPLSKDPDKNPAESVKRRKFKRMRPSDNRRRRNRNKGTVIDIL
jgi:elongation factor 1-alpha